MAITVEVNYLAVFVSGIAGMVIGSLWYGPLFGKQWMALMGFTHNDMEKAKQKGMTKSYIVMFIALLVMAFGLAHVIGAFQAATAWEGIVGGFWTWLSFVATIAIGSVLWEGRPTRLFWLNSLHWLVVLSVMGAILAVWK